MSGWFTPSGDSVLGQNNSSFLDNWIQTISKLFSELPNQVNTAVTAISPYILRAYNWLKEQDYSTELVTTIYTELKEWSKEITLDWEVIKEMISEFWAQKSKLRKSISKLSEHSEILIKLYQELKKSKSDWVGALKWISEKVGGYRSMFKHLLEENDVIFSQLSKLKDKWSDISEKVGVIVKKINEKKNDLNEIFQDVNSSKLTEEGGFWSQLKTNLSDHIIAFAAESDKFESWIITLKEQKEKVKKLINNSSKAISTWLTKKDEFSKILGLDQSGSKQSSGGFKFDDVITKLKDINDTSFEKLEEIQTTLLKQTGTSRWLIKRSGSSGGGWSGFINLVNKWDKYKTVFDMYSLNGSGSQST